MTQIYDVLIIGSGAGGGMAAWTLARAGVKCLMLDAGPAIDYDKQRVMKAVYDLPYRGFGKPGRFPHLVQASEFDANLWADEKQNPYTYDPEDPYYWVRIRAIGGKTLRWGRQSWRLSDYEFKCKDHDGFGENWPIRYSDLASYYDRVEPMFKVTGRKEGLPQLPDGIYIPDDSSDSSCVQRFSEACKKRNIPVTKMRRATGTLASSANLLLPDALESGNLTLTPNAVVREVTVDPKTGLANGVLFLDRRSKREYHAKAKIVVVAASCIESVRILLNSKSRLYPNGLGNSSGTLGQYLFDQFYVKNGVVAIVPEARGGKGSRGLMGGGGYVPRFRNLAAKEKNFIRGYAYDFGSGFTPNAKFFPTYGDELWRVLNDAAGAGFNITTMGEALPRKENHIRINPNVKDEWGIPAVHLTQKYLDNEHAMARDAMETGMELCSDAGFEVIANHPQMVPPGESIHELGGCRMGGNPKNSVLNRHNQSHDVKNLFVVDGSSFVSGGTQNPTLTILALAMRAGEYIVEERKKGAL
ncbi:MAG TPA: GMC family oxidoreductase [Bryobacteraceae bacterium]|nr:GMC family oxidoreductase [Bryobacteraceae bacterium]